MGIASVQLNHLLVRFKILMLTKERKELSMMFVRLYSGQDGQSHFEELGTRKGSTLFSKTRTRVEVVFKNNPPSQGAEWHTAPRRLYLITLN